MAHALRRRAAGRGGIRRARRDGRQLRLRNLARCLFGLRERDARFQDGQDTGRGQLQWVDLSGKVLSTIGQRTEAYALRISPDGRSASVLEGDPNNDIWIYDLERGVRTRLTTDTQARCPRSGRRTARRSSTTAERPQRRAPNTRSPASPRSERERVGSRGARRIGSKSTDWSPDGRHALMDRGNIAVHRHLGLSAGGSGEGLPLVQTANLDADGRFSPDGRWIAYTSLQSSQFEIYVTGFPVAGARWQVSANGGTDARWAPDGKRIYFLSLDNQVMAAPVDASGAEFRVEGRAAFPDQRVRRSPDLERVRARAGWQALPRQQPGDVEAPRVVLISNWASALPR